MSAYGAPRSQPKGVSADYRGRGLRALPRGPRSRHRATHSRPEAAAAVPRRCDRRDVAPRLRSAARVPARAAGAEGLEPPAYGFGDRQRSDSERLSQADLTARAPAALSEVASFRKGCAPHLIRSEPVPAETAPSWYKPATDESELLHRGGAAVALRRGCASNNLRPRTGRGSDAQPDPTRERTRRLAGLAATAGRRHRDLRLADRDRAGRPSRLPCEHGLPIPRAR